jgi:16S rRNA (guanine527-N7)-methyltransferase
MQELLEWNKSINLTAIRDPYDIIIKHFVDSLTPLPYLELTGRLLDIGPGAGFPSIPMKIAVPQLQAQLVDANRKKVSFLKHLIRTLRLEGITALHSRVEEMERPEKPFEIIVSRAFQRLEPLIKLIAPHMDPGNVIVGMLGPTSEKQRRNLEHCASAESLDLRRTVCLELPMGRGRRTLLFFKKT